MRKIPALIVALAALVACAPTSDAQPIPTTKPPALKVLQIGDSLTERSAWTAKLQYADAGFRATVEGRPSTALAAPNADGFLWLPRLRRLLADVRPDIVVVELGTNDAFREATPDQFARALDELMAVIGNRPVFWVNVVTPSAWSTIQTGGDTINEILKLAVWHENLTVVDMAAAMAPHHDLLLADGMHFNMWGQIIYADAIIRAVKGT